MCPPSLVAHLHDTGVAVGAPPLSEAWGTATYTKAGFGSLRAVLRERAACGGSLLVKFSARPAVRGMHVFKMLLVTVEFGFVGVLLEVSIERRDSHRRSLERVDGFAAGHRARGKSHVGQFLIGHFTRAVLVHDVFLELCVGGHVEPTTWALDRAFVAIIAGTRWCRLEYSPPQASPSPLRSTSEPVEFSSASKTPVAQEMLSPPRRCT